MRRSPRMRCGVQVAACWRTKLILALFLVAVLLVAGSAGSEGAGTRARAGEPDDGLLNRAASGTGARAGEILVRFKPDLAGEAMRRRQALAGARATRPIFGSEVQVWQVEPGKEAGLLAELAADPAIARAEPNYIYRAFLAPNDPAYSHQWAHVKLQSDAGWELTTGDERLTIAVIDTGIDETHPDLAGKLAPGYDFVDDDDDPHDLNGHGTHCAGIAAAMTDNSVGVAGTNWHAPIMPVRVLNDTGNGTGDDIIAGINWASAHGAKVLNLSLGGYTASTLLQDAVNAAHAAGCLVVAAMGNDRTSSPAYPAACDHVLAVGATNYLDGIAPYSNYGTHCDVSAPGGAMSYYHDTKGIYSTMPTYSVYLTTHYQYSTNYDYLQGTSQATPYVSGLASLVWARNPALTPDRVQRLIEEQATDLGPAGWDVEFGHGRVGVASTLTAVPQFSGVGQTLHLLLGED